jgi:hypothetical protein
LKWIIVSKISTSKQICEIEKNREKITSVLTKWKNCRKKKNEPLCKAKTSEEIIRSLKVKAQAPLGDDYFNVMRSMLERERDFTPVTASIVDRHVLARGKRPICESYRLCSQTYCEGGEYKN